jgi:L-Ala-D/L-Glu epimerase
MSRSLALRVERWPIAGRFTISRGSKTEVKTLVVEISDGNHRGRGECVPYARYGETIENVAATVERLAGEISAGLNRTGLQEALPRGAARNAIDCALWDIEAKQTGRRVWELAGIAAPKSVTTAFTLSLATPQAMHEAARSTKFPLLKLKLGAVGDPERLLAVRSARPDARLIVDANEGWQLENLEENLAVCMHTRVELIEQPLPAGGDGALATIERSIPVCADESVHDRKSLVGLRAKYDAVNIKLDKTGGLTEALALANAAELEGFVLMIGSMVSTSLGVAPALLLAARARFIDLDGPLLLAKDRPEKLRYDNGLVLPPERELWG